MRLLSPARSAFHRATGAADSVSNPWSKQVVPVGTRCRLRGIWMGKFDVVRDSMKDAVIELRNGDGTGELLFMVAPTKADQVIPPFLIPVNSGSFSDMIDLPGSGILFDDGLNLKINFDPGGSFTAATTTAKFMINVFYL